MLHPIVDFFDKLITDFSKGRLIFVIILVLLGMAVFWGYETYTDHLRLSRIEQSVELLEKLAELEANSKLGENKKIAALRQGLIRELDACINGNTDRQKIEFQSWMKKALAACFPWFLLLILFLFVGEKSPSNTYVGLLVLSMPLIVIGGILPDFELRWINYLGYPLGAFVVVMGLVFLFTKDDEDD